MSFHYFDPSASPIDISPAIDANRNRPKTVAPNRVRAMLASPYRRGGKRLLDLGLCLLSLPFVVPLVAILALLISLTGNRPFYTQHRVGQHRQIFKMWKLRSMIQNSDLILETHLAENPGARTEWRNRQKLKSDPRITAFGAVLRKTSLDELPQLWNVLRGDMSLVGPRPMMISQEPLYPGQHYYAMLPGISGNWQVSKRNESHFAERAAFDTEYHANLTLRGDLRILKDTVGVVLRATGH